MKIEIQLPAQAPLRFRSIGALKRWAEAELAFWDELAPIRSAAPDSQALRFDSARSTLQRIASLGDDAEEAVAQGLLKEAVDHLVVTSKDPRAQFLVALRKGGVPDKVIGATLLAYVNPQRLTRLIANTTWNVVVIQALALSGIPHAVPSPESIFAAKESVDADAEEAKRVLQDARDLIGAISSLRDQFGEAAQSEMQAAKEAFQSTVSSFNEEREDLRRRLSDAMALRAPADYWITKAQTHETESTRYRRWFIAILVAGVAAVMIIAVAWLVPFMTSHKDAWWAVLLTSLLIAIWAWPLRLTSRLYLSHRHLAEDARERTVITKTFLALSETLEMTVEDRQLLLSALFRSAGGGLVQDEGTLSLSDLLVTRLITKA